MQRYSESVRLVNCKDQLGPPPCLCSYSRYRGTHTSATTGNCLPPRYTPAAPFAVKLSLKLTGDQEATLRTRQKHFENRPGRAMISRMVSREVSQQVKSFSKLLIIRAVFFDLIVFVPRAMHRAKSVLEHLGEHRDVTSTVSPRPLIDVPLLGTASTTPWPARSGLPRTPRVPPTPTRAATSTSPSHRSPERWEPRLAALTSQNRHCRRKSPRRSAAPGLRTTLSSSAARSSRQRRCSSTLLTRAQL